MSELPVKWPPSSAGGCFGNLGLSEFKTVLFSCVTTIFVTLPETKVLSLDSPRSFESEALNSAPQKTVSRGCIMSQDSLRPKSPK